MIDAAADDVEKIDLAGGNHAPRDLNAFFTGQTLFPIFISDHAQHRPMKSGPTASRTASITRKEKRRRLSRLPLYSSRSNIGGR